jgi:hypothetical protein
MFKFRDPPGELTLPQSGERLRWQMEMIGWGPAELANRLSVNPDKVHRWLRDKSNIPNTVSVWLETLAWTVVAVIEPIGWNPDKSIGKARHEDGIKLTKDGFGQEEFFGQDDVAAD